MPFEPSIRPLGAFLKALRQEKIDCILIGMMAAIEQGAPLMTVSMGINFYRIRLGAWPSTNLNHEVCPAAQHVVFANSRVRGAVRGHFFRLG